MGPSLHVKRHHHPMSQEIRVRVPDELYARFEAARPKYVDTKGFLCTLIEEGLTKFTTQNKLSACHAGAAGATTSTDEVGLTSSTTPLEKGSLGESEPIKGQPLKKGDSKEGEKDPFRFRKLDPDVIPCDLLDCQQLLPEFWSVKKGVRSQQVFNRICNKLSAWTPEQRRQALESAISNGWGDVFEPRPQRQQAPGCKPLDQLAAEMEAMPRLW